MGSSSTKVVERSESIRHGAWCVEATASYNLKKVHGIFGRCPKLSKLSKVIPFEKPKKIKDFLIQQAWHRYCIAIVSESEPSRIPVVISGLWR